MIQVLSYLFLICFFHSAHSQTPELAITGLSASQVQSRLTEIKTEYNNGHDQAALEKALTDLQKLKNQTSLVQTLPANPVSRSFKDFHLSLLEIKQVNAYLNSCTKNDGVVSRSLRKKIDFFTDGLVKQSTTTGGIPTRGECEAVRPRAIEELDHFTQSTLTSLDRSTRLNIDGTSYDQVRKQLIQSAPQSDSMGAQLPAELKRRQAEQKSAELDEQASKILLRNTGEDVRDSGVATQDYIRKKYGLEAKFADDGAKNLHDELMKGNRENCLANYLNFTQRYDFSGEASITSYREVKQKVLDLFGKARTYSYSTLPPYEETELSKGGLEELAQLKKKYPKAKSLNDTYEELKPIVNDFLAAAEFKRRNKGVNFQMYDDSRIERQNLKSSLSGFENEKLNHAFDKMKNSDSGFLLQTKAFQDNIAKIANLPENRQADKVKEVFGAALKEQIENTKKYSQWIDRVQGDKTFDNQDKAKFNYEKESEILLYSSPSVIAKTLRTHPELLGSLCAPIQASAKRKDNPLPAWVNWGGGGVSFLGGGVGIAAQITAGVLLTGFVISDSEQEISSASLQRDFAGEGDLAKQRDFRTIQADRKDLEKTIALQNDRIEEQLKTFGLSLGATITNRVYRELEATKDLTSLQKRMVYRPATSPEELEISLKKLAERADRLNREIISSNEVIKAEALRLGLSQKELEQVIQLNPGQEKYKGIQSLITKRDANVKQRMSVLTNYSETNADYQEFSFYPDRKLFFQARPPTEKELGQKYIKSLGLEKAKVVSQKPLDISPTRFPEFNPSGAHPSKLNLKEIKMLQSNVSNTFSDGSHTIIENAVAIKTGRLDPSSFPPIRVWRDREGNVWTLDHRRYVQNLLAGEKDIKVIWVNEKLAMKDLRKMSGSANSQFTYLYISDDQSIQVPLPH